MRRILVPLVAALAVLVVGGFLLNRLVSVPPHYAGPADLRLSCPMAIFQPGELADDTAGRKADWVVSHTLAGGREPDIRVTSSSDVDTPTGVDTCLIDIRTPPAEPYQGIDWRIGHAIPMPAALRGKAKHARILLRADRPVSFDAASFYGYDGIAVRGATVSTLGPDWQEFRFDLPPNPDAPVLELWLRMTIHGGISNPARVYFGGAQLTVDPS